MLTDAVTHIQVSGTLCGADGTYKSQGDELWKLDTNFVLGGQIVRMVWIENCGECWDIWCYENLEFENPDCLWECPNCENNPLPPKAGWKARSELVRRECGTPKIECIFGNSAD